MANIDLKASMLSKLKKYTGAVLLLLLVNPVVFAEGWPANIDATVRDSDGVFDGYLLWHQSDELKNDVDNVTLLSDSQGKLVHYWKTNLTGGGTPAYLLSNGLLVRSGITDPIYSRSGPVASVDTVQICDAEGLAIWEIRAQSLNGMRFHHDFEVMPNGNILISTYEPLTSEEALDLGWDVGDEPLIWSDGVIEVEPNMNDGSYKLLWHWRVVDHLVQDRNPALPNYGSVSEQSGRIDPYYPTNYAPRNVIRQHINSIDFNAELDQILLSSFIYNEVWIIDHSTSTAQASGSTGGRSGRGGDLLYRFGNPEAFGRGSAADRKFLKQHDANWIEAGLAGEGNVLVHNNNTVFKPSTLSATPKSADFDPATSESSLEAEEGESNVYELRLRPVANGTYSLNSDGIFDTEVVWLWSNQGYFADFQGGARRLSNGNTLLTDTTDYLVVEVDSAGDIVAEYRGAAPVYKAFKYDAEHVSELLQ